MEIKDLIANTGNVDLVAEVVSKEDERTFEKFGKSGRVCNAKLKDNSGEIKLTLWNDDIDQIKVGDKIHLQNGWCSEYKGEKQLSSGKFGKIEVVKKVVLQKRGLQKEDSAEDAPKEIMTNDPDIFAGVSPEEDMPDDLERIEDEEIIE